MADADRLLEHSLRFAVRSYELDENGHVNNAVFLNWAEHLAAEHAEAMGFGRGWNDAHGGTWVVRRHEVVYRQPALLGDAVEATVRVLALGGVRGVRHTAFRRVGDATELARVRSEWVWVGTDNGRPRRLPEELLAAYRPLLAAGDGR